MRYDYKIVGVDKSVDPRFPDGNVEDNLRVLGLEGWELVNILDGKAYLKKVLSDAKPAPKCPSCEKLAKDLPGLHEPTAASATPDENSAWHWTARSEFGEKRVEAITNEVAGVKSPEHKHRVVCIVDKDGKVVRGQTDMVNGHAHQITVPGMTDDADGHTHTFVPNFHA